MLDRMRIGRRLLAVLLIAAGLGACGSVQDPPPQGPDGAPVERVGALKAGTWRGLAAAEAARVARLHAAIRRARRSTTVNGALRLALLTRRIEPHTHARLAREYAAARAAVRRLPASRAGELGAVVGTVEQLAAAHALTARRLPAMFLILRRNTRFWSRAAWPAPSQRTTFGRDPAIFQYYPGRGMQMQPLASWGKANWLARSCLNTRATARRRSACPARRLRRTVDRLLELGARRGGFLAWEHYFAWAGGTAPWISGMTQATAVSALARAARALEEPRWERAARRALGAFRTPPPVGVDGGDHFLMYSFAPGLRIFNGELQAVSGIGELAALSGDIGARRLFARGERAARGMVKASDTGAWSLYSQSGRESTLGYHQLVGEFLGDMCALTRRRTYCDAHVRFARYEREPTRIGVVPLRGLRARHATALRFAISKVSRVRVRLWGPHGLSLSRELDLPYGVHTVGWTPPSRGRFLLRIEAQGPSGPLGTEQRRFRIVLPKPKPKRRCPKPKRSRQRGDDRPHCPPRRSGDDRAIDAPSKREDG
jgi:hypothetical protein